MGSQPARMREALAFGSGTGQLADIDPEARPLIPRKKHGKPKKLTKGSTDAKTIADLQERLWAESAAGGRRSVLLVLQGIDTAGKGGVSEHVVGACGPIGLEYAAFTKPTRAELRHDFLWRIRKRVPAPGVITIFDRSHYEDVLVTRVHNLVPEEIWNARYDQINAFEQDLVDNGTTVLKCFLHISYDAQRKRLLSRLDKPSKHWKFNDADIDDRAFWASYQNAFQAMLTRCNTAAAPWYVVPSDSKKYRNWAVAELLRETLQSLDPQYPRVNLDVPALRARLKPPN